MNPFAGSQTIEKENAGIWNLHIKAGTAMASWMAGQVEDQRTWGTADISASSSWTGWENLEGLVSSMVIRSRDTRMNFQKLPADEQGYCSWEYLAQCR